MSAFDAGNFEGSYNTPFGQAAWSLLNENRTIDVMKLATNLGKPALEGAEEYLLERFKDQADQLMEDRSKQMIGAMVKQVMGEAGYGIEQRDVKINSAIFSRATRYVRKELMIFHAWRGKQRSVALTATASRDSLPEGNWKYWKAIHSGLPAGVVLGLSDQAGTMDKILSNGHVILDIPRLFRAAP